MNANGLRFAACAVTVAMAVASIAAAGRHERTGSWRLSAVLAGRTTALAAVAVVAYTLVRDAAVVAMLEHNGIDPSAFLFVDCVSSIPYLLSAPRVVTALMQGDIRGNVRWLGGLAFGMLAPGLYLLVECRFGSRTLVSSLIVYLGAVIALWLFGHRRLVRPGLRESRPAMASTTMRSRRAGRV